MALLKTENISVSYDGTKIIEDINIELNDGELVCLLGVSGSGKSTLFNVISGLLTPDSGHVLFKGEDITGRSGMFSYMLQKDLLLPYKTIIDNVILPLTLKGISKKDARKRVLPYFEEFGISGCERKYPNQLSGGMRQRVMIAMALACEPDILIADEPTTALDVTIQAQILDLMRDLQKKMGMAIIMITHDLGVVAQMCDEVIVMYAGSICEQGTADEIFYNPRHEYTKGLMRSIPTAENNGQRLEPITGTPIDLLNMPKGCPFAPRCEAAMKICLKEKPVRMLINDDHMATCWMNVKKGVEDGSITEEGGVPCV